MEDKIKDALCDMYDIKRQSELHKFGKLPKDNEGTSTSILDCINSVICFLERLDYPELSTDDLSNQVLTKIKKWLKDEVKEHQDCSDAYENGEEPIMSDHSDEICVGRHEVCVSLLYYIGYWEKEVK